MVKALAVDVSGFVAVKGTTKEFLNNHDFYIFHFPSQMKAEEFKNSVLEYIDSKLGCTGRTLHQLFPMNQT